MVVDQVREFLSDPIVIALIGGVLLTGMYWSLVFALRRKGGCNGR